MQDPINLIDPDGKTPVGLCIGNSLIDTAKQQIALETEISSIEAQLESKNKCGGSQGSKTGALQDRLNSLRQQLKGISYFNNALTCDLSRQLPIPDLSL